MSVKDTIVLNRSDLKYLLIDSLRLYSNNVVFLDGQNPYRFSTNKKTFYVFIRNVHESGNGRTNPNECRIQVNKSKNFNTALSSSTLVIVLGYYPDIKVFTAWNPYLMRDRFNARDMISLYSRFTVQDRAAQNGIATYVDADQQSVISFRPEYLGLYLENVNNIHLLDEAELLKLISKSDSLNEDNHDGEFEAEGERLTITHTRYARDPLFRRMVYSAYNFKCAMCGIQLELIEAAHIVPHSHEKGTDDIGNGVCLCALHHTAYDQSLVYFDDTFSIKINKEKIKYLEKIGLDGGFRKLQELSFDKMILPQNHTHHPNISNIKLANQIRGIGEV
jgi:putative restriction endonuclease